MPRAGSRILLLGGDADHNVGDRAIVEALVRCLTQVDPAADISIVGTPEFLSGIPGVSRIIPRGARGFGALLRAAARADRVVIAGGGLFQDDDSRAKMPYWAARIGLLNDKTAIVNYERRFRRDREGTHELAPDVLAAVLRAFESYLDTIPTGKRASSRTYAVKDVVGRSGFGIGSAGLLLTGSVGFDGADKAAASAAASALSGYAANALKEAVAPGAPIDVIKVDVGEGGDLSRGRLEVGTYLTDSIYVSYARRFNAQPLENANEAILEYRFKPRWTLETRYGDANAGGLDLTWTYKH